MSKLLLMGTLFTSRSAIVAALSERASIVHVTNGEATWNGNPVTLREGLIFQGGTLVPLEKPIVAEVHDKPTTLIGFYHGDNDVADIVIRKCHLGGCSTDAGFKYNPDKKAYQAIVDHGYGISKKLIGSSDFADRYNVHESIETAAAQGLELVEQTNVAGETVLVFSGYVEDQVSVFV